MSEQCGRQPGGRRGSGRRVDAGGPERRRLPLGVLRIIGRAAHGTDHGEQRTATGVAALSNGRGDLGCRVRMGSVTEHQIEQDHPDASIRGGSPDEAAPHGLIHHRMRTAQRVRIVARIDDHVLCPRDRLADNQRARWHGRFDSPGGQHIPGLRGE